MRIFIDNLKLIRIESNEFIHQIELANNQVHWLKNEGFNQFFRTEKPIRLHQDETIVINGKTYLLEIGIVTLTKEFDRKYRYQGELGVIYGKKESIFRVFSPVAKEVNLIINQTVYPMTYKRSIWEVIVKGDLEYQTYQFQVRLQDQFKLVSDPYAKALTNNLPTVVDLAKIKRPKKIKKQIEEPIIYEGHARDLTIFLDVENQGKFKGLTEYSETLKGNVLDYIRKLGPNRLQLLPVFDFEGIDEKDPESYNWGYNPKHIFALHSWFQTDKNNPYSVLLDFRNVVTYAHRIGLGINLDVVYNHMNFRFDDLVPGYYYRHDKNHKMTDDSFCGNDIETERYMVRKLIIDNLKHYVNVFNVDGFRFDLMGLLDIKTLQQSEAELKKINPDIMLYGEGWNMNSALHPARRANMSNEKKLISFGHFNDDYRNFFKGNLDGSSAGYGFGKRLSISKLKQLIKGSKHLFSQSEQSINYVECHDNLTFYDQGIINLYSSKMVRHAQDFVNQIIAISAGVPFYHAGQEQYRSKDNNPNSYRAPDSINGIVWQDNNSKRKLKRILMFRKQFLTNEIIAQGKFIAIEGLPVFKVDTSAGRFLLIIKNNYFEVMIPKKKWILHFSPEATKIRKHSMLLKYPGVYILRQKGVK
ncbi:MAG: alpha-amylase family glycosyl hydrolase [Acholeplasmataceae bacterium]